MERTMEIPRQGWFVYFQDLGKRALNHPVRVEVDDLDVGDQALARAPPLLGIELEKKGSGRGDIELLLGDERQEFLHRIEEAEHVYIMMNEGGDLECLSIQDRAGGKTLVFFEGEVGVSAWERTESGQADEAPMSP